jgi:hypothetical protein
MEFLADLAETPAADVNPVSPDHATERLASPASNSILDSSFFYHIFASPC